MESVKKQDSIFRSESRLSSPEKLNDYIKVSSRGVWIILVAAAVMLVAAVVWAVAYELPEGIRPIEFLTGAGPK